MKPPFPSFFSRRKKNEIDPDEIFLDARNMPAFDTNQFEGRIETPINRRSLTLLCILFVFIGALIMTRVWILQMPRGDAYVLLSEKNRLRHVPIFPDRGIIYDREGVELAWNVPQDGELFSLRQYKSDRGLAHVLGYVSYPRRDKNGFFYQTDIMGKTGVEKMRNTMLAGKSGVQIIETNAREEIQSASVLERPKNGSTITLTVDVSVQTKLYGIIQELAERVGFRAGAGVLMDVHTGELLAMVNFPEYDLGVLASSTPGSVLRAYVDDERKPFLNRVVSGVYTPGSIIKPFLALAALEEGIILPSKEILSTGSLSVPNLYDPTHKSIFKDWKAHGYVDMRRALAVSSNVYFYTIGGGYGDQPGLGIGNIARYAKLFGFGGTTGFGMDSEAEGMVPTPAWKQEHFEDGVWRFGDTYNTAIGQYGFGVTPLQVVRAVAALANGGTLLKPQIEKISDARPRGAIELPFRESSFAVVREGMRQAVEAGTAKGLLFQNFALAAKTGTAQIGVSKKYVNSWVIGFFPYEKPTYAFAVVMEHGPVENLTGGVYVMRTLLDWMQMYKSEYTK